MFQFFVRDDVTYDGRDECGYPVERLIYYVVCEAPNGRRWAHHAYYTDDGVWKAGERSAERLRARIAAAYAAGREPDFDHWHEIDPAYGSDAYQGLDEQKVFRNREIMDAHDSGEINEREASLLMMR